MNELDAGVVETALVGGVEGLAVLAATEQFAMLGGGLRADTHESAAAAV